jgi:hypothetical protein
MERFIVALTRLSCFQFSPSQQIALNISPEMNAKY